MRLDGCGHTHLLQVPAGRELLPVTFSTPLQHGCDLLRLACLLHVAPALLIRKQTFVLYGGRNGTRIPRVMLFACFSDVLLYETSCNSQDSALTVVRRPYLEIPACINNRCLPAMHASYMESDAVITVAAA